MYLTSTHVNCATCNFIKKETLAQMFSYEFCEMSKITFFTEHLWETASVYDMTMVLTV